MRQRRVTRKPPGLSVREAAFLLSMSEPQVRRRLASGALANAGAPGRVTATSVRALFEEPSREVQECVLQRLLDDEVEVPPPETRSARHSPYALIAFTVLASVTPQQREQMYSWGKARRKRERLEGAQNRFP
jgi:hypothetical protein